MIRAAFFDIDGTLLSHKTGRIPVSAARAVRFLHEQGVLLFIATGRHILEMDQVPGLMALPWDGFVTLDGQYCTDRTEAYFKNPMDPEDVENLIIHTERLQIPCMFVEEKEMYVSRVSERVARIQALLRLPPVPQRDLAQCRSHEILLAATYCLPAEQAILMRELKHARTAQWHDFGFDIFHSGGGKDVGIRKTCERFGLSLEETIAFGDSENDLNMLRCVGIGIAMGNATEEVKRVCDFVTAGIDEDGIERALQALRSGITKGGGHETLHHHKI